jgi:RNA polymerase sigma-70 factor, ECF subfamily
MAREASDPADFSDSSDERYLVEAARRDPKCFAELYERNFELVYSFVARRVGDRHAAEDLTSEVFLRALAAIRAFEWRGVPFSAWLIRIASNAVKDRWKSEANAKLVTADEEPIAPTSPLFDDGLRLYALVEKLPSDQKRVIVLRFSEEKSIRDIAGELGRTEGAVKQLQFRALKNLRQWLDGRDG